jgi:DNA-binding response OmpR family regulator
MGLKILVADDEADITDVMARKIAAEGYEVIKAYDGQEAWDRILADRPDMVLLDVNMPRKDGFAILRELRAGPPEAQGLPVIIISARQELDDIKRGMDLEADHYLTKPCAMSDVIKAIRLMERLRRQRRTASD